MVTFDDSESSTERARRAISRVALTVAGVLSIAGLTLGELGLSRESVVALEAGCAILLALPVLSVISALIEEIRRRDWPFVAAAFLVLALLAYSVLEKIG
jgi:uncharacterized membrane protein